MNSTNFAWYGLGNLKTPWNLGSPLCTNPRNSGNSWQNLYGIQLYVSQLNLMPDCIIKTDSIILKSTLNKGLMTVCQNKTSENLVGELLICSSRLAPGSLKNSFVLIVITMEWNHLWCKNLSFSSHCLSKQTFCMLFEYGY